MADFSLDANSLLQILEIFPGNRQSSPRGPAPSCQPRSDVLYKNSKKFFF